MSQIHGEVLVKFGWHGTWEGRGKAGGGKKEDEMGQARQGEDGPMGGLAQGGVELGLGT